MSDQESPAYGVATITPSDSTDLTSEARALYIGTAGALKFNDHNGTTITFANAIAGYHPVRVTRVWATGTLATDIHALY